MWTATLYQIDNDGQRASAVVLFTDSLKYKILETFDLKGETSASFRGRIESRRKQLEQSYTFIDSIDLKTFSLAPDSDIVPIPDDRQNFFKDFANLQQLQTLVDLKVLNGSEKEYLDLQARLVSEYKPEYFS